MSGAGARADEPAFNAPWPVLALVAALIGTHVARTALGIPIDPFAFTSQDLAAQRWAGLITYQFTHANWLHVLTNATVTLAFGTPVARLMGRSARGAGVFLLFFLACGVAAALGYAPLAGAPEWALVGCSGAASGLMGAAARIIEGRGRVGSLFGRTVLGMTMGWAIVNVVFGISGLTPGAAGMPVAWQAHIVGFLAGLLLIGPFARLAGPHKVITH